MMGKIDSFHSFSTNDGPGIRAVLFLQGCPLRCKCCHNPETWDSTKGKSVSVDDVMKMIKKGLTYYKNGGVTCSGGEALLQPKFVYEIFRKCHEIGLHTTLDTSGCILNDEVITLLNETDLVLLDVKMTTEEKYKEFANGSLEQTIRFLDTLESLKKEVWIRQVIIPNLNDSEEDVERLKDLLKNYQCIKKVEFLPFRSLCISKYEELGIDFTLKNTREANQEDIERIEKWYLDKDKN